MYNFYSALLSLQLQRKSGREIALLCSYDTREEISRPLVIAISIGDPSSHKQTSAYGLIFEVPPHKSETIRGMLTPLKTGFVDQNNRLVAALSSFVFQGFRFFRSLPNPRATEQDSIPTNPVKGLGVKSAFWPYF